MAPPRPPPGHRSRSVPSAATGTEASSLGQTGRVVQASANWTNAHGGINGHPLKLYNQDDGSDPARSVAIVHTFVQQDHVVAIVAENSIVDTAWASYVQQQKVPVVGSAIFNIVYEENPDFFSPGETTVSGSYSTLAAAKKLGDTKFGLLYCAEAAACTAAVPLLKALAPSAGETLTYSAKVSAFTSNFTAECLAAKAAGVDVLTSATDSLTATRVASDCAAQDYHPGWVGNDGSVTQAWLKTPALNGVLTGQPVFPYGDTSTQAEKDFRAALRSRRAGSSAPRASPKTTPKTGRAVSCSWRRPRPPTWVTTPPPLRSFKASTRSRGETLDGLVPPLTYTAGQPTQINCWFYLGITNGQFTTPDGLTPSCVPTGVKLPS